MLWFDLYPSLCKVIFLQPGWLSRYLGEGLLQLWPRLKRGRCLSCVDVTWMALLQTKLNYVSPVLRGGQSMLRSKGRSPAAPGWQLCS